MTTTTATHRGHKLTTIFDRHNVSIPPDLAADIDVPVLTGPQRQGDVGIFPRPPAGAAELTSMSPIPAEGVRVVRGEATGNAHILHADGPAVLWSASSGGLRLGVLEGYVTEHLDPAVGAAFQAMLTRLSRRGVRLTPLTIAELADLPKINAKGGLVGAEAHAWHAPLLETRADFYDPWVRERFSAGRSQTAEDYIRVIEARARLRALVAERQAPFDALLLPTVQIVAPIIESLADSAVSAPVNLLCLRNTAVGNFLDLPAISIPCHDEGALPVGAMLMGRTGDDRRLLSIARGLEGTIRSH